MHKIFSFALLASFLYAQPVPPSPPKIQLSPDEAAYQAAARVKDPVERNEAFIKFVAEHPNYPYIRNTVFYLGRSFKDVQNDPIKIRSMVDRFVEGTAGAPRYARAEFYFGISKALATSNLLLDRAAGLAEKGTALLNEQEYVANERRSYDLKREYDRQRNPNSNAEPEPFSEAQAIEKFRAFHAGQYANLGQIYLKQNHLDDAQKALLESYKIRPVMESATGLSELMEKRGDTNQAFHYMADAMLTGRLNAEKIAHLEELYRKTHPDQPQGLQAYLDDKYRQSFHSPLKVVPYQRSSPGSHTVLAEFVTGAGCEPCTAVDLAFDAELQRYSRNDLVLLVYHMHAPTSDPMSNPSAEKRHKYYDTHGAPTVYLDGKHVEPGEGLRTEATRIYTALDAAVQSRLAAPARTHLTVDAKLDGARMVNVRIAVKDMPNPAPGLRLQIALAENEIAYSGENGLRFHPFVVRNLAQGSGSEVPGFALSSGHNGVFEYAFDLDAISAANLKYYDEYIAGLKKRTNGAITASFKEKRYIIDPGKLSVVAFLQDDATKAIQQAAYQRVSPVEVSAR